MMVMGILLLQATPVPGFASLHPGYGFEITPPRPA